MVKEGAPILSDKNESGEKESLSTSVSLSEVMASGSRLEASTFDAEARSAVAKITSFHDGFQPLLGNDGLAVECSTPIRLKRVSVGPDKGIPFLTSSDIIYLYPAAQSHISRKLTSRSSELLIKEWDVLVSRSGTIGNIGFAGRRMANMALSEHALRLGATNKYTAGFIAAFLRSKYGRLQLTKATYGSVVVHIEPQHLETVFVPKFHPVARSEIGKLFVQACETRDQANDLIDEANQLLHAKLDLPPLITLASRKVGLGHSVQASDLERFTFILNR